MAEGATILANMQLRQDATSDSGLKLLRFALAVDPDNTRALLLQAKVERGQELDNYAFQDGGRQFINYLQNVIKATKSPKHQLLLWKVIELIDPDNATALVILTKAKNSGTDIRFETLLGAITGEKPPPRTPATSPDDANAGGNARKSLEELKIASFAINTHSPVYAINELSKHLHGNGVEIALKVTGLSSQRYYDSTTGAPRFSTFGSYPVDPAVRAMGTRMFENISGEMAAKLISRYFKLGYKCEGNKLIFTDPDDEDALKETGHFKDAALFRKEYDDANLDTLKKYRGKTIEIQGLVSGAGRSMANHYVNLCNDKVRVMMDSKADREKLLKLQNEFQELERMYGSRPSRYYLRFIGSGIFKGERGGRLLIDDCTDFTWTRVYSSSP
jgi:hypothetical protein